MPHVDNHTYLYRKVVLTICGLHAPVELSACLCTVPPGPFVYISLRRCPNNLQSNCDISAGGQPLEFDILVRNSCRNGVYTAPKDPLHLRATDHPEKSAIRFGTLTFATTSSYRACLPYTIGQRILHHSSQRTYGVSKTARLEIVRRRRPRSFAR